MLIQAYIRIRSLQVYIAYENEGRAPIEEVGHVASAMMWPAFGLLFLLSSQRAQERSRENNDDCWSPQSIE